MATVRLFGRIGDVASWTESVVPATTLGELRRAIGAADARLSEHLCHPSTLVIINNVLTPHSRLDDALAIAHGDEVAFGSPVSGG